MTGLNLHKLFVDVFHPEPGEQVVVMTDEPHGSLPDSEAWRDRRQMAAEWHEAWVKLGQQLGFSVLPLVTYPATGEHNRELPFGAGQPMPLQQALSEATLGVAITEYSATAPMVQWTKQHEDIRVATLPGVARRTEKTALAADYTEVARRCQILADQLTEATSAYVQFSTGHEWRVDLRYRDVKMDNGQLPRGKPGVPIINLPSGETFQVPYEGERAGEPSLTAGEIPVDYAGNLVVFQVKNNRIVSVTGEADQTAQLYEYFAEDPARSNIAEFAFGCNPKAVVWGNVLEDEKAGFHWAYGRSEHVGGTVRAEDFRSPETVVHQDIVYAKDSPITVAVVELGYPDSSTRTIIRQGEYSLF